MPRPLLMPKFKYFFFDIDFDFASDDTLLLSEARDLSSSSLLSSS